MSEKRFFASVEEFKLTADIRVYCDPRLKDLAGAEADKRHLPLSEFVVQVLAEFLGEPELAKIPRKAAGRPRLPAIDGNGHRKIKGM